MILLSLVKRHFEAVSRGSSVCHSNCPLSFGQFASTMLNRKPTHSTPIFLPPFCDLEVGTARNTHIHTDHATACYSSIFIQQNDHRSHVQTKRHKYLQQWCHGKVKQRHPLSFKRLKTFKDRSFLKLHHQS